ncbi:unnamed protein product [Acanthoscelides obtectus]|uniref:Uncharacterized protein n=1 Tax=Acanthoscelides obtectus TaxID=200917 RepID=A0A9P0K268_ACAOB|nr:unnamed protein product [Acanthoscelides obtectus]CAK1639004.1 hypothetical protein AOBTE_LOCUS10939 [Acanthoscelides obtectus]
MLSACRCKRESMLRTDVSKIWSCPTAVYSNLILAPRLNLTMKCPTSRKFRDFQFL